MSLQQWLVPSALGYVFQKPLKMGLATLSYTSTGSSLNLPEIKVFSGQKRLFWSLCQTCCKQARDFQLLCLPVSRAPYGYVCPADAGMAKPGNSSSRVQLLCRGLKWWESTILCFKMYSVTLDPTSTNWNMSPLSAKNWEPHSYFQVHTWKSNTGIRAEVWGHLNLQTEPLIHQRLLVNPWCHSPPPAFTSSV